MVQKQISCLVKNLLVSLFGGKERWGVLLTEEFEKVGFKQMGMPASQEERSNRLLRMAVGFVGKFGPGL